jgi:hypothetical protein
MKRYHVVLKAEERQQLERWLKNPPRPYLRERARALLLIADGQPGQQVSQMLRRRVHRTTIGEWVKRFQAEGLAGLQIKPGRGRKPLFFPSLAVTGPGGSGAAPAPHSA